MSERLKGFKHIKAGNEVAQLFQDHFGRNKRHYIGIIESVDFLNDEIHIKGGNRYGLDGLQKGCGSTARARLVELTDEIRREVFRREAKSTLTSAVSYHWDKLPDDLVRQLLDLLPDEVK